MNRKPTKTVVADTELVLNESVRWRNGDQAGT